MKAICSGSVSQQLRDIVSNGIPQQFYSNRLLWKDISNEASCSQARLRPVDFLTSDRDTGIGYSS